MTFLVCGLKDHFKKDQMFIEKKEKLLGENFVKNGYSIHKIKNKKDLEYINKKFVKFFEKELKVKIRSPQKFFNSIHEKLDIKNLNKIRLSLINKVTAKKDFRIAYYNVAREILNSIVGNELAMQNAINLSIQLPNDKSSLLAMHADTWSGDSPFEVVIWLPLVNVYKTKSMYILPAKEYKFFEKKFFQFKNKSSAFLFNKIKKKVKWLNIKHGEFLIFNQSLPHGNVVNIETESRISMNCRFKGLYTPYGSKNIGDFFEPITLKPASEIGINYEFPKI